jgi:uncharacterized damage-inducible protein DinB
MTYLFKKSVAIIVLNGFFICFAFQAKAQLLSSEDIKTQFIKDWERAKSYTLEYLNTVPADKYSFKAVDSIRSFAQQMLHLAQGNVNLISNGTGQEHIFSGRNLDASPGALAKDSVLYYVSESYDFAITGIKNLDASKLGEITGSGNFKQTRFAWILKAFEHQTHHRGQATIYIRLLGIRPPNERLF